MVRLGRGPLEFPKVEIPASASSALAVRFWGTRGSLPVSGPAFARYGGSTVCFEVRCGQDCMLFDAGSGIAPAGQALKAEGVKSVNVFFTHCHYDHIVGFPFFAPIYDPNASVRFWSGHLHGQTTTEQMLEEFMRPPWFPIRPDVCPGRLAFSDFASGDTLTPVPGVRLVTRSLNHPGNAVGYRIEWQGKVVAIVTDTEHRPGEIDRNVMDLIDGADLFLYDASYTEAEMQKFRGFGHSTWEQAVHLAHEAGARRVAMVHHAPWRTDDDLDAIDARARELHPGAFVAADAQVIEV